MSKEEKDRDDLRENLEEICFDAMQKCRNRLAKNSPPVNMKELKDIMFITREAWYLINSDIILDIGHKMEDEDEEEDEDEDDNEYER